MSVEVKTKNGYVKIANNLFDNIIFRDFNNRERAVIFLVIRLSYGFNHKAAIIKPKARFGLIGMHRQHIDRALDSLIAKNVIIDRGNDEFMLNKHFDTWKVKLNKHFNEDNFNELKGLQFRGNVTATVTNSNQECDINNFEDVTPVVTNCNQECNTDCNNDGYKMQTTTVTNSNQECDINNFEDVTPVVTNCNQECNTDCNNDGYKMQTTTVTNSNQTENSEVTTTVTNFENCNHHGYNEVTTTVTKNEILSPPRLQGQPENANSDSDTSTPKDIIKDNIKTCIKDISLIGEEKKEGTKKFDPYFNNPIVEKFKKEYEKNFDKKRCYLDNFKINKLIEISVDNPDFVEKLPEIIKKFSKLKFTNAPATLKWLINEGGWAGILNGEYDSFVKNEDSQNDGFDLGIPVWSED